MLETASLNFSSSVKMRMSSLTTLPTMLLPSACTQRTLQLTLCQALLGGTQGATVALDSWLHSLKHALADNAKTFPHPIPICRGCCTGAHALDAASGAAITTRKTQCEGIPQPSRDWHLHEVWAPP